MQWLLLWILCQDFLKNLETSSNLFTRINSRANRVLKLVTLILSAHVPEEELVLILVVLVFVFCGGLEVLLMVLDVVFILMVSVLRVAMVTKTVGWFGENSFQINSKIHY